MSAHPLISGFSAPPPITARLALDMPPGGVCFSSFEELRQWIESAIVEFNVRSNSVVFGTAGTIEGATIADRDKLRLVFDDEGRCMGFAVWSPEAKTWVRNGCPGELLTVFRTEGTLARDMEVKMLVHGWLLCDGSTVGAPDLRGLAGDPPVHADNDFFRKDEGEWTVYTVMKIL